MSKYPTWEEYKKLVEGRGPGAYRDLGLIVIRVVEDCGMEECAEVMCIRAKLLVEEDIEDEFDFMVEHMLGENNALSKAIVSVFFSHVGL